MTVIIHVEAHGQTEAGYEGMLKVLAEPLRRAEGFVLHSAYCVDGQWRVLEVWRSKADADRFFASAIAPNLPPGVRPKRTLHEAHSLVTVPQAATDLRQRAE
jgi:quinol monooxygenase YgiN